MLVLTAKTAFLPHFGSSSTHKFPYCQQFAKLPLPFLPPQMLDSDQVLNTIRWAVSRPQGFEAVMRVRCSTGLELRGYMGGLYFGGEGNSTDIYFPGISSETCITADLKLDEKM